MDIISGYARFSGPNEVILEDGRSLKFRKCILGTGVTYSQLRLCVDFFDGQVWTPVESLDSFDAEFPKSCHDLLWSAEKLSDFEKYPKVHVRKDFLSTEVVMLLQVMKHSFQQKCPSNQQQPRRQPKYLKS